MTLQRKVKNPLQITTILDEILNKKLKIDQSLLNLKFHRSKERIKHLGEVLTNLSIIAKKFFMKKMFFYITETKNILIF